MDPKREIDARANPLLIAEAGSLPDDDLRDHLAIYRGLRDHLQAGSTSVLDVLGQMHDVLGFMTEVIGMLEAEARRRGLDGEE